MISHSKKFSFIHIPKAAGKSIEAALDEYWDDRDELHPVYEDDSYYQFCCARNTYERLVSYYFYKHRNSYDEKRFDKFIRSCCDQAYAERRKYLNSGSSQYLDATHFVPTLASVNRIIRFDHLQEDFDLVCDEIGIPRRELPILNTSKHEHFSFYYSTTLIELIQHSYSKEIEMFKF